MVVTTARRWVFDRYHDVLTALHEPSLVVPGTARVASPEHRDVRRAVTGDRTALTATAARPALQAHACTLIASLPGNRTPSDWCAVVAGPWSRAATARLMTLDDAVVLRNEPLSRTVFDAAAQSMDGDTSEAAKSVIVGLAATFATTFAGELSPASVQTFVALTQSLPAVLSSIMHALLSNPAQQGWLLSQAAAPEAALSAVLTGAADELLRYATPVQAVYRRALASVRVGGCDIDVGDLVVLRLADANRDGTVFHHPETLNFSRGTPGHVSFGAGAHRCVGAVIIRTLVACLLEAMLVTGARFSFAPGVPVEWIEGPTMRAPRRLPVVRAN